MKLNVGNEKRLHIIYTTVFLWVVFGIAAALYSIPYSSMAVYFLSLTGFVSAYIWGESVRKSRNTPLFQTGTTSSREKMMYVTMFLWTVLGVFGLLKQSDFVNLAAYFSALTPFVGAYILGKSYKPNGENQSTDNQNNGSDPINTEIG
jgi:hypothetical protein